MGNKNSYWKKWFLAFLFGVALITVYKTFDNLSAVFGAIGKFVSLFTPFIIGFILAFFLYPAARKLEKSLEKSKKSFLVTHKKGVSISVVYFSFVALLVLAISVILPKLSSSVGDFFNKIPEYIVEIENYINHITRRGGLLERLHLDEWIRSINITGLFQNLLTQDVWSYVEGVKGVTGVLMNWLMGIVICAYALLEKESLLRIVRSASGLAMKPETTKNVGGYISKICDIFYKFFFGKAIDSLIIGIIAVIGFSLLKVPYAVLMGVIVGVFNMIPYFGPFIGAVPAVLVVLLGKGLYPTVWTAVFIFALQQFDGLWLGPKILGDSVGVSPFWVIFAILIFGGMFGIWGMIFGVPLIAAIRMLCQDYFDDGKLNLSVSVGKKAETPKTEE